MQVLNNAIDKGYNTIGKFVSYGNTNREKIGKAVVNTFLLIIIFAVFGCFDFLTFSFHFEYLATVSYWTGVLSKAIAGGICAFNIGINLSWDNEIEKDTILRENAEKYDRLNKLRDAKSFNKYVTEVFNPSEKKRAYIGQINNKIYKLDKYAKNKDKLLYSSENEEEKAKNKYCIKRKELEMLKSEDYIAKNLDNIHVNYYYVDPIVFDMELDGKTSYKGKRVTGSVAEGKVKATANVVVGMIGISMFITSLGASVSQEEFANQMVRFWHYCVKLIADIGVIVWQTLRGVFSSRKLISQQLTQPLINRNEVLTGYIEWCAENNIETSKATKIYQKIVESENSYEEMVKR